MALEDHDLEGWDDMSESDIPEDAIQFAQVPAAILTTLSDLLVTNVLLARIHCSVRTPILERDRTWSRRCPALDNNSCP